MRLSVPSFLGFIKTRQLFTKLVVVLIVLSAFFLFCKTPSFAQTTTTTTQSVVFSNNNTGVAQNMDTYTQSIMLGFMGGLGCQLAGYNPITQDHQCLGYDKTTGKYSYVNYNDGLIGFLSNMILTLYAPPIHTSDYFQYLAGNFGIAKDAYAQYGVGLDSLHPISGLFVTFRNISYFIFVIIFVFIGLGIMLRTTIDARTVMTIQNQIPKIIIGIILITLSFAISGLMVDLMWVLIIAVINTFISAHPPLAASINGQDWLTTPFALTNVVGGFFGVSIDTAGAVGSTFNAIISPNNYSSGLQLPGITTQPSCSFPFDISGCVNQAIGSIIGFLVGAVAFLVIIIALIVAMFKLWFALLKAYIMAIFDIIFAPFWILAGLVPKAGPNVGFTAWLKDLLSNLLPFPAVIGLFLMARIIADGLTNTPNFFSPPLIGAGQNVNIGAIIAFGIIMFSPNIVNSIKSMFKTSGPGGGMGSVGTGMAALGAVGGAVKRKAYWRDSQGNTHGMGAELGRSLGRKTSSVLDNNRLSRGVNKIAPIKAARAKWTSWTNPEINKLSEEQRAAAYSGLKEGKSLRQQAREAEAREKIDGPEREEKQKQQSTAEMSQAVRGGLIDALRETGMTPKPTDTGPEAADTDDKATT